MPERNIVPATDAQKMQLGTSVVNLLDLDRSGMQELLMHGGLYKTDIEQLFKEMAGPQYSFRGASYLTTVKYVRAYSLLKMYIESEPRPSPNLFDVIGDPELPAQGQVQKTLRLASFNWRVKTFPQAHALLKRDGFALADLWETVAFMEQHGHVVVDLGRRANSLCGVFSGHSVSGMSYDSSCTQLIPCTWTVAIAGGRAVIPPWGTEPSTSAWLSTGTSWNPKNLPRTPTEGIYLISENK